MQKFRLGAALWAAMSGLAGTALAEDIRPGMAISPEDLPPEAQHYERLLRGDSSADSRSWDDDSVDERRHFHDHLLHAGLATGVGTPVGVLGAYFEVDPWDALAVGVGGGVSFWGPSGGGFLRLRPYVWGGQGNGALHAFTLQTSYTYMLHGEDPLRDVEFGFYDCEVGACPEAEPEFVPTGAHFLSLSAGFEHAFYSEWSIRYEYGFARALSATKWQCTMGGRPAPCTGSSPSDTMVVIGFTLSHAL